MKITFDSHSHLPPAFLRPAVEFMYSVFEFQGKNTSLCERMMRAFLFLPQAVAEPRQFQQSRSSRAGSEKVKAIEHPVNFQNKTQYSAHVAYHNVIYVPNHPFYKGNGRKDKAWHLIAVVLGVEVEYIRFRIIA